MRMADLRDWAGEKGNVQRPKDWQGNVEAPSIQTWQTEVRFSLSCKTRCVRERQESIGPGDGKSWEQSGSLYAHAPSWGHEKEACSELLTLEIGTVLEGGHEDRQSANIGWSSHPAGTVQQGLIFEWSGTVRFEAGELCSPAENWTSNGWLPIYSNFDQLDNFIEVEIDLLCGQFLY